jgi:hypothetical protein
MCPFELWQSIKWPGSPDATVYEMSIGRPKYTFELKIKIVFLTSFVLKFHY